MIHAQYHGIDLLKNIVRFMYAFSWLLPLSLWGLYCLPFRLSSALALSSGLSLVLLWWVGASGAGMGRNIFSLAGPSLCVCASYTLSKILNLNDTKKD
jgi:hypothetical protein